jgi:hypothetical protein
MQKLIGLAKEELAKARALWDSEVLGVFRQELIRRKQQRMFHRACIRAFIINLIDSIAALIL